jgi:PST family polysaccharide transporter
MDDNRILVSATIKGTAWNYLIFGLSKGVTFVATVLLARLLSPDEFGLMALGLIVIGYLDTFSGLGVENVVIFKQENVEHNSNVAFTLGLVFNTIISVTTFLIAPWVATFFNDPRVTDILRALSIIFIIWGLGNIHAARLKKELQFRQTLLPELGKSLAKAIVSIGLALAGYGVWSLVWGQIAANIAASSLYWLVYRWRPRLTLDMRTSRHLLGYSSQTVLSEFMGAILTNIDYLIVGKRLGPDNLGYYTMAFRVPELLIINTCYIVSNALFPAYSKLQNDLESLRKGFLLTLRYIALYTVPVGVGMFIVTPEFVKVIFGDQWIPAIPVMQAISLYAVIYSLSFNAGDIYKAIGRPDIMNILGIFKLAIAVPLLWLAGGYNIYYVGLAQVIAHTFLTLMRFVFIKRMISLRLRDILSALQPAISGTLVMFLCVYALQSWLKSMTPLFQLVILPVVGGLVYGAAIWFTNRDVARKGIDMLRNTFSKKSKLEIDQ